MLHDKLTDSICFCERCYKYKSTVIAFDIRRKRLFRRL